MPTSAPLARHLGVTDAVFIGLGSMVGAGVFAAFTPAAAAAGSWLLLGLSIAAVVAYANATSSAQLAAQYPTSGGTYVYGRERLGPWAGFLAGWAFVVGKTASCAAMALTFGAYAVPGHRGWQRAAAVAAVVALTATNLRGVTRTARLARVLVVPVLAVLALVVMLVAMGSPDVGAGGTGTSTATSPLGVLQSAGLLFFAFAGYARIATLGEEVRDPRRTIPRAIQGALAITVVVYLAVGVALLHALGAPALAHTTTPVAAAVEAVGAGWASPVVRVAAALACLGSLLALIAGISRTTLAMARERDLPMGLAHVDQRHRVPDRAQLLVAAVVVVLVATTDLRGVIGFSSFGVLLYYGVANASAFTQDGAHRRFPRALQVLGVVGCSVLAVTLPATSVLVGVAALTVGVVGRLVVRTRSARRSG